MKLYKLILIAITAGFVSCTAANDEDVLVQNNLEQTLRTGTWTVNYYLNNNIEETTEFGGYVITFADRGIVKAVKQGVELNGTWVEDKVTKVIVINFNQLIDPFNKITDVWRIHTKADKSIQFVNQDDTELLKIVQP